MRTSKLCSLASAALACCLLAPALVPAAAWLPADSAYAWRFPADHWSHPGYRTEWWYLTAQLQADDDSTQAYGVQFTFFRVGLSTDRAPLDSDWNASDLIMGHAAIGDVAAGRHRFSELLYRATPLLGQFNPAPDSLIAWSRAPAGTDGRWTLAWNGEGFSVAMVDSARQMAFRLDSRALKPLVLQGPNGYSRKGRGPDSASQYYSFTRLAVTGVLALDGRERRVHGQGWFDKEFSSSPLEPHQEGWDWFSLQLDDGRELMLYTLRDREGQVDWQRGTLVAPDGAVRYLGAGDWSATPIGSWTSEATGTRYPSRWQLRVPAAQLELDVSPRLLAQENVSRLGDLHYWEGAVELHAPDGAPRGRGYVELVGVGGGKRPSF
jgi:predicted secreted hydrolase